MFKGNLSVAIYDERYFFHVLNRHNIEEACTPSFESHHSSTNELAQRIFCMTTLFLDALFHTAYFDSSSWIEQSMLVMVAVKYRQVSMSRVLSAPLSILTCFQIKYSTSDPCGSPIFFLPSSNKSCSRESCVGLTSTVQLNIAIERELQCTC